jgi:HlyD family secretion protein
MRGKTTIAIPSALAALALLLAGCALDTSTPHAPRAEAAATASAKGRIDVEGGVIRLAAQRDGVVQKVFVEEGQRVRAGDPLAQLDDQSARLAARLARAEWEQVQRAVPPIAVRLAAAERELRRVEPLAADNTVPRQTLDEAVDRVRLLRAELAQAQAAVATSARKVEAVEHEIALRVVRAPLDGTIVRRQARPGDGVSTLNVTPLFLFAPDAPRIVRAEVEERFLRMMAPGQAAEVVLEADDTRRYPAKVVRLGQVVGARTPSDDPAERQDNRVVECVLSVDAPDVLIGQRVIVRFEGKA